MKEQLTKGININCAGRKRGKRGRNNKIK